MILDGVKGIQQLQEKYKEKLLIMFLIKNEEGKYLVSKNPFFSNQFSFMCCKKESSTETQLLDFIYNECGFAYTLEKFIERIPSVATIDSNLTTTEFLCFTIKKDNELTKEMKATLQKPKPSGHYTEQKFVTLQELKSMFFGKTLDGTSMFFALRDGEIPVNSGKITVTFDTSAGE